MKRLLLLVLSVCFVFGVQRVGQSDARPGYTINFENVAIIEFLKFVSKIGDVNFVYNEEELNFNVTIVSEEETSLTNVMAALVQVLRINGFSLIDDGSNLVIHKADGVNQIATVISPEMPYEGSKPPPIVTRLFKIRNGNPEQIAKIVKPLMSKDVILEVSSETRHLLVTDIVANVDRVADLLLTLDAAASPLDLDVYHVKNTVADKIVPLAEQILTPLSEGNPLVIVPQPETQAVYVLSTPFLVEKAMAVLEDLDETPTMAAQALSGNNVLIYKLQYQSPQAIEEGIDQIGENLTGTGGATSQLVMAAKSMRYVQATNSLIFTGAPSALDEIKTILQSLDTPATPEAQNVGSTFFIYKIQQANEEQISKSLNNLAENLEDSKYPDEPLISAIDSMKWVKETNSLIFTGSPGAITRLKEIVPTFDVDPGESRAYLKQIPASTDFYIYTPKIRDGKKLLGTIDQIADNLRASGLTDPAFLRALESAKWNPSTSSILFTGDAGSLQRVKDLVQTLDTEEETSPNKTQVFIYKPNYIQAKSLQKALENLADNLPKHDDLREAIDSLKYSPDSNSFVFKGSVKGIDRLKELLPVFDTQADEDQLSQLEGSSKFFVYKPKHRDAADIETDLKQMAVDLQEAGLSNPDLLETIDSMRYSANNNSLVFAGSPSTIAELQSLLATIDSGTRDYDQIGNTTFIIYKLQHVSGRQLITSLNGIASDLSTVGTSDKELISTIKTARYIPETNSVIFTGPPSALERVQALAEKFDLASLDEGVETPTGFVVYNPKYLGGEELIQIMRDFENNLITSGVSDPQLFNTINTLKWMPKTSSILISGTQESIDRTEELLKRFDVAGLSTGTKPNEVIDTIDDVSFLIYKLQYHQGTEIESALQKIATDLKKGKGSEKNEPLIEAIQSVQWIEVTNSLIGTGKPKTLERLRSLIKNIDIPLKQVFIEVLVIDTDISNTLSLGLRWGSQGKYRKKLGWAGGAFPLVQGAQGETLSGFNTELGKINSTTTPTGNNIPQASGFSLGVIGDLIFHKGQSYAALGSLVDALRTDGDISLVLNQKVITQDGKQSTLFSGSNIPFNGSVVQTNQTGATQQFTSNIEYRDVGINLTITPRVGDDGMITMLVDEEITQQTNTGQNDNSSSGNTTPTVFGIETSKNSTQTQVTMPDDHFLVLSGSIRNQTNTERTSIPCLGGLPLIGAAFTRNETLTTKRNVIIFMKPKIINTFANYNEITERQEEILTNDSPVAEQVEKGFDLVKTPDDERLEP